MWEKRQTSHAKELWIIYLDSTLKEVENNFPPLKCSDFLPNSTAWKGYKKSNLIVAKPPNTTEVIKLTSTVLGHIVNIYPLCDCDDNGTLPVWSSCQKTITLV